MIHTFEAEEELNTIQSQEDDAVVETVVSGETGTQSIEVSDIESFISPSEDAAVFQTTEDVISIFEAPEAVVHTFETSPPKGDKGDPGITAGMLVEYPVAYPMSGHRLVVLNENQEAVYASNLNPFHATKVLGMTTGAVISGLIGIQTGGSLNEPSWNWTLDVPIWLGVDGFMTQVVPVSGFSLTVGFPISSTSMFISIGEPIILV